MTEERVARSRVRNMRNVVNYQGLDTVTIACDNCLPCIQTNPVTPWGATEFSALDHEVGFHRIRTADGTPCNTALCPVFGLPEYKVVQLQGFPCGL